MRNAQGLSRSAEFLKAHPEQAPAVHHIRIQKHEGGVRVTHHASTDGKPFAEHRFSHGEGEELMAHVAKHTGYEAGADEPDGLHAPESEDEI